MLPASACPEALAPNIGSRLLSCSDLVSPQAGWCSLHGHPKRTFECQALVLTLLPLCSLYTFISIPGPSEHLPAAVLWDSRWHSLAFFFSNHGRCLRAFGARPWPPCSSALGLVLTAMPRPFQPGAGVAPSTASSGLTPSALWGVIPLELLQDLFQGTVAPSVLPISLSLRPKVLRCPSVELPRVHTIGEAWAALPADGSGDHEDQNGGPPSATVSRRPPLCRRAACRADGTVLFCFVFSFYEEGSQL